MEEGGEEVGLCYASRAQVARRLRGDWGGIGPGVGRARGVGVGGRGGVCLGRDLVRGSAPRASSAHLRPPVGGGKLEGGGGTRQEASKDGGERRGRSILQGFHREVPGSGGVLSIRKRALLFQVSLVSISALPGLCVVNASVSYGFLASGIRGVLGPRFWISTSLAHCLTSFA